jgi:chorismate mutase
MVTEETADTIRLDALREEIAQVDEALVDALARRLALAAEIGRIKDRLKLQVLDPAREAEVVRRAAALARDRGVDPELARDVFWRVIAQARVVQHRRQAGATQPDR